MVFSSLTFVFVFLTLQLFVYICFARTIKQKNIVLLLFSLFFYMWGGAAYVPLLMGMTGICWLGARIIDRPSSGGRMRKTVLAVCCVLMLGLLGFFKYTGFFLQNIQLLFGVPEQIPEIVLPIGISFYTFQLLSYVVDVYRDEVSAQKSYWQLLLYASMFHQCIAGPIIRYKDINRELRHRKMDLKGMSEGITRFTVGLAKKAVLANGCAQVADALLQEETLSQASAAALWIGMLFYMLEIYLDFSAYSDMAIGMGRMIGFHYKENFNYPYTANSVTDFWHRWHISLSTFFRDYVYIPLGGNRKGTLRTIRNLFVVWFLTGMWHGASWNYILWGLYFFAFLVLEKYLLRRTGIGSQEQGEGQGKARGFVRAVLSHLYLLLVVYFGWVLFRFTDLAQIGVVLKGMFCRNGNAFLDLATKVQLKNELFFLLAAVLAATPLVKKAAAAFRSFCMRRYQVPVLYYVCETLLPPAMLVLSLLALVGDSYNPFIYYQF